MWIIAFVLRRVGLASLKLAGTMTLVRDPATGAQCCSSSALADRACRLACCASRRAAPCGRPAGPHVPSAPGPRALIFVDLSAQACWRGFRVFVLAPGAPLTHPKPHWTVNLAGGSDPDVPPCAGVQGRGRAVCRDHRHQRDDDHGARRRKRDARGDSRRAGSRSAAARFSARPCRRVLVLSDRSCRPPAQRRPSHQHHADDLDRMAISPATPRDQGAAGRERGKSRLSGVDGRPLPGNLCAAEKRPRVAVLLIAVSGTEFRLPFIDRLLRDGAWRSRSAAISRKRGRFRAR